MHNFKKIDKYYSYSRPEIIKLVPLSVKKVLDIGCGEGLFLSSLKKRSQIETWGVEINHDASVVAKINADKIIEGDICNIIDYLPESYFDCVVFNDILEHLVDPYSILEKIKAKLNKDGIVICSIPNIRYFDVLIDLLFKKQWKYEDSGVLDRTHLRFFTKKSIIDMFDDLGYEIIKIEGIHRVKMWKLILINMLTLGFFKDSVYIQFACIVKPKIKI